MHGLKPRKPLEGALYGISTGGRVLGRRGKGGQRRAPPRQRPQPTTPQPGFPAPSNEVTSPNVPSIPSQTTPSAPVQKQYGDVDPTPVVDPQPIEEVEEIASTTPDVVEEVPIAAPEETTIQDGSERVSLGLTSLESTVEEPVEDVQSDEERTSDLLKRAQESAKEQGYETQIRTPATPPEPVEEKRDRTPRKISKAKRNNQKVEQRATRARRLNRSRHVEYRYEMRALLKEIEVAPEQHSVLLGTIWAKGERQDVNAAKDFVRERVNSGAITEDQCERLISVIDAYTTRR